VALLQTASSSTSRDFVRVLTQKFGQGRFLVLGADGEKLERQFAEMGREAVVGESGADLAAKLMQNGAAAHFETAVWFYSSEKSNDERIAEELSRRANDVVLLPNAGADAITRRPEVVECFGRFGLVPDYRCDLTNLDPRAIYLRHQSEETAQALVPAVETAFARLNTHVGDLERILRTRMSELDAADRHIARLEEKLLKLKQYRRELKVLREEKRTLRKSPERRIGQVLLAPYRLPQKLVKAVWSKISHGTERGRPTPAGEYQEWFERHRAKASDLDGMQQEIRSRFTYQPLISIITPVFNTPVPWLEEAVQSVLAQAYENWELILIDDKSSAPELLEALPGLAARDPRIVLASIGEHKGISAASNQGLALARGEWIGLLDHDDLLEPDALFQVVKRLQANPDADLIYSDEDKLTENGFEAPSFKPDWSPDFFLSYNYICHFICLRRALAVGARGFRSEYDGAQDYDLFLRILAHTTQIHHIPRVLYHWRRSANSVADNIRCKPEVLESARRAIEDDLKRRGERGHVTVDWRTQAFWVRRELLEAKKISIIIPTRDGIDLLSRCIESLTGKTNYSNYEIVVVDNDSQSSEAHSYFARFRHRLLSYHGPFNFAALNNFAVQQTESPWLLFLNNDIEVIESDWLTIMAEHVQRPEIGAVGARLLYPDDTVQHAGVVLGLAGAADHAFRGLPAESPGVNRQLQVTRNWSAVTGACLLTRREVFEEVGGFDEERLPVNFNDVDLCLRMRRAGYLIVYTPFAKLYHHESATRRRNIDSLETDVMRERWASLLERDPYYNPNLSRERPDFSLGT
jgi:GT2 family glycosyltransferase